MRLAEKICNKISPSKTNKPKAAILDIGGNVNAIPPIIKNLLNYTGVDYITLQKGTSDNGTEKNINGINFKFEKESYGFTYWQNTSIPRHKLLFYGDNMLKDSDLKSEFLSGCNLSQFLYKNYEDSYEVISVDAIYYCAALIQGLVYHSNNCYNFKPDCNNIYKTYSIRRHFEMGPKETKSENGKSEINGHWDVDRPEMRITATTSGNQSYGSGYGHLIVPDTYPGLSVNFLAGFLRRIDILNSLREYMHDPVFKKVNVKALLQKINNEKDEDFDYPMARPYDILSQNAMHETSNKDEDVMVCSTASIVIWQTSASVASDAANAMEN